MLCYFINDLHIDQWVESDAKYANTAPYKKLLKKWCLPADCLFIAGDIACSPIAIYSTMMVLREMYKHIFYVYGNHEMRVDGDDKRRGLTSYTKRDRIEQFMETATMDYRKKIDLLTVLKGNSTFWNGVRVAGGMGYADLTLSSDPESSLFCWQKGSDYEKFDLGWSRDLKEIAEYENGSIEKSKDLGSCDVVMSHFAPVQGIVKDPKLEELGLDYGLSSFDGSKILSKLKDGAIWHFGHLHDQIKEEKKVNGRKILFLNNSIGSPDKKPLHQLDKSEFLIEVSTKF